MSSIDEIIDQYYYGDIGTTTTTSSNELDQAAFLNLLVVQLQNQDPLEPMKNEDFIAQLATFSSLEEQIALNDSMETMLGLQAFDYANSLIDKEIYWYNEDGEAMSGVVDYVEFASYEEPVLFIGDYGVPLSSVLGTGVPTVETAESALTLNDLADYLGKTVSWYNGDGDLVSGVVDSIELLSDNTPAMIVDDEIVTLADLVAVQA